MKRQIVCIASEFKGNEFLEECANAGWDVTLVTRECLLDSAWSWTAVGEVRTVSDYAQVEEYVRAIANLAGTKILDRIVGLDEFDVVTAARAREHLQLGGMTSSHALRFRDKLAMRNVAAKAGIPCPNYIAAFNPDSINAFVDSTTGPWAVKPRQEVSAFGIRKCDTKDEVWDALKSLDHRDTWRDHPSQFLIEQFIIGNVFHVDSVVYDGEVKACGVSKYGTPPFSVTHYGGVFTSSIIPYDAAEKKILEELNTQLLTAFDFKQGVTHAEFLQSGTDGRFYLLEVACRVGGAYIANVLEHARNFNLWREWARIEISSPEEPYQPPKLRDDFAGVALALANQDAPDTSHYTENEIVYRVAKPKHVGLIFYSQDNGRLTELLSTYSDRITNDFLAVAPAKERYDD